MRGACMNALALVLLALANWPAQVAAARLVTPLDKQQPARFELKFQAELDNSTLIKRPEQQQVFKCQIRLAPLAVAGESNARAYFRSTQRLVDAPANQQQPPSLVGHDFEGQLNVSRLAIEWLRDGRALGSDADQLEPVAVINVSLRTQPDDQAQRAPKSKRARLEIKNTLNGPQLKLTSRLRILRLRQADAGQYKCVGLASFNQRQGNAAQMAQVEQSLESNATALIVASSPALAEANNDFARHHPDGAASAHNAGARRKWSPTSAEAPPAGRQLAKGPPHVAAAVAGPATSAGGQVLAATNQLDGLADTSTRGAGREEAGGSSSGWNLFEDDEDLFRPELGERAGELINGQPPRLRRPAAGATNEENNDNTSSQEQMIEFAEPTAPSTGTDQQDAYLDWVLQQQQQQQQQEGPANGAAAGEESQVQAPARPPFGWSGHGTGPASHQSNLTSTNDRPAGANQVSSFLRYQQESADEAAGGGGGLAGHSKLAKLVHRIAPELSCYTGVGEYYQGEIATSVDQRPCLNWYHVRLALAASLQRAKWDANRSATNDNRDNQWPSAAAAAAQLAERLQRARPRLDDHNACRNPNSDPRGPWCFVAHSEQLDGPLEQRQAAFADPTGSLKLTTRKQRLVRPGPNGQLFLIRPCAIASCSEYLWLYVAASPLGLLLLLVCLLSLAVRAIRKSHYDAIFSANYQRHSNAGASNSAHSPRAIGRNLSRLFRTGRLSAGRQRGLFATAGKQGGTSAGKRANSSCLADTIFEIADEIDWSDGQTPTSSAKNSISSPKSSESSPLTAAPTSGGRSTLSHSKSVTPMLGGAQAEVETGPLVAHQASPAPRMMSQMSKSKSQAGPVFATLRCHVRNAQRQRLNEQTSAAGGQQKSSFIDNADLGSSSTWLDASITSDLSSLQADCGANSAGTSVKTGRLISCGSSSTSSSCNNFPPSPEQKLILARELPLLEATSVSLMHELQPIYEGKFSQVQWAYLKQRDNDPAQATGRIGAQVAVCGLKQQAGQLDGGVFTPNNLRLRHLNHLNVLKLIGYLHLEAEQQGAASCALVYDMAHLIDLSDWLKEQSKEAVVAGGDEPSAELGLRQNLACLAKQIALAIDYLHDRQIVYKDLACRNCFLDVTRMLVKLATFNVEPEFEQAPSSAGEYDVPQAGDSIRLNAPGPTQTNEVSAICLNDDLRRRLSLKSMVRPKYLLDYYVIDSRPSECQLLPLSWIPLESILFNKFNKQTDVWSFGCLLYELFSLGEVAYFGYSSKQVIDSVRSNLMPPQPMLCPNGVYKLMCKCLSDIPTLRPTIKHIYEQLNLYSGQCSSFLNHHLCNM